MLDVRIAAQPSLLKSFERRQPLDEDDNHKQTHVKTIIVTKAAPVLRMSISSESVQEHLGPLEDLQRQGKVLKDSL